LLDTTRAKQLGALKIHDLSFPHCDDTTDSRLTFDALMLGVTCNQTRPTEAEATAAAAAAAPTAAKCDIYVAVGGDDSKSGNSPGSALATVQAGIAASRKVSGSTKSLCVGPGSFQLSKALEVTSEDSGLAISGVAGETWITASQQLPKLEWEQYKVAPAVPGTLSAHLDTDNQQGCSPSDPSPIAAGGCGCYNNSQSADSCRAKCQAMGAAKCTSYAWSGSDDEGGWANQCCIHADNVWNPQTGKPEYKNHVAGNWVGQVGAKNVWKAKLPAGFKLPASPHLRVNGARSPRARFPDANPEVDIWPVGWVPDAQTWLPAKTPVTQPTNIQVQAPILQTRNEGITLAETKNYSGGINGPCEVFSPPFSYWCSAHPAGGGGFQYYVPSGMALPADTFPSGAGPSEWASHGAGATVHAFRRSHWASWMFDVAAVAGGGGKDGSTIKFGKGGYQGCRGGPGQDW
jgi:hypothetical protein